MALSVAAFSIRDSSGLLDGLLRQAGHGLQVGFELLHDDLQLSGSEDKSGISYLPLRESILLSTI